MNCLPLLLAVTVSAVCMPARSQSPGLVKEVPIVQNADAGGRIRETEAMRQIRLLGKKQVLDPKLEATLGSLRILPSKDVKEGDTDEWLKSLVPDNLVRARRAKDDPRWIILPGTPRLSDGLPKLILPDRTVATLGGGAAVGSEQLWKGRRPEGFNPFGFLEVVGLLNLKLNVGCTGTLVAPNTVLTAAHCVGSANGGDIRVLIHSRTEFQEKRCQAAMEQRRYIRCTTVTFAPAPARTEIHPAYVNGLTTYDLALIILEKDVEAARIARIDFLATFSEVTLAGFGVTNLEKDKTPEDMADLVQRLEVGWHAGDFGKDTTSLAWTVDPASLLRSGGCKGDSGGPVFAHHRDGYEVQGFHQLVAVIREGTSETCTRYVNRQTRLSNDMVKLWLCEKVDRKHMNGCPTAVARN